MTRLGHRALVTLCAFGLVIGGGAAVADTHAPAPRLGAAECGGFASAYNPDVKAALIAAGLNPAEAKGPVGAYCTVTGRAAQVDYSLKLEGIEGILFTCAKAEKKTDVITFFNDCKS
ncbi:hypothetical protein ABTZ99_33525 [Actinosynnema sp. NPDC002837]